MKDEGERMGSKSKSKSKSKNNPARMYADNEWNYCHHYQHTL